MTRDELKQRVYQAIDQHADEIIGLGEQIRRNPELGFKEVKTARLVEETFKKLGLAPRTGRWRGSIRTRSPRTRSGRMAGSGTAWSNGLPSTYLGMTHAPRRAATQTFSATPGRQSSDAISIALLPIPTTTTRLPTMSCGSPGSM